jgi:hypothetical protein
MFKASSCGFNIVFMCFEYLSDCFQTRVSQLSRARGVLGLPSSLLHTGIKNVALKSINVFYIYPTYATP